MKMTNNKMKMTKMLLVGFLSVLVFQSTALAGDNIDDYSWIRGANYVPSYAKNDVGIWMDYDPVVIDRELGYAGKLKLNTVRVFLQVAVYEKQPGKFLADFESFLSLCDKHNIKMMPVLFDSCFDPQVVDLMDYYDKNWMPSPGFDRLQDRKAMEAYIQAVVGKYNNDERIVMWDVMNEPELTAKYREPESRQIINDFVVWALGRVRHKSPVQPLTVGWALHTNLSVTVDLVDVISFHCYSEPALFDSTVASVQFLGRTHKKPVVINEFAGRPRQPIESALPIVTARGIGWVFWELMLGRTQFTQGERPYQGHIYPDGTCYLATEVATILNPGGYSGSAERIAMQAGFKVSDKAPKSFTEAGISFSPLWQKWTGNGPADNRLWFCLAAGQTASMEVEGQSVSLVMKFGPDCGIATVTIDGKPIESGEINTYSAEVDWNRRIVVAENLAEGRHKVVVTVTGKKVAESSGYYVQIVNIAE